MRQHALKSALEAASRSPSPDPAVLTHAAEQEALRKETISAFHTAVPEAPANESNSEDDDFLVPRELTKDELEKQQEEYRAFLTREVGKDITDLITVEDGLGALVDDGEEGEKGGRASSVGKKGKKKKKGKEKEKIKESDQEFLMK